MLKTTTTTTTNKHLCVIGAVYIMSVFILIVIPDISAAPLSPKFNETKQNDTNDTGLDGLEYERYLRQVIEVLETDKNFKDKISNADIDDIRTGKIANELKFVKHNVRTKLDELKRREIDRMRMVLKEKYAMERGLTPGEAEEFKEMISHVDHDNPDKFEISDLEKLIKKATYDLEQMDSQRRDDFKKYEMEKEVKRRQKLNDLDEESRLAEEKTYQEMQAKHKDHDKLKHPGSKAQFEEVWEESDGLDREDFDPKTFFKLHDTSDDGYLDLSEVMALFQKELEKVYQDANEEDDMIEFDEEMNRMREHVMTEVDLDKDGLISLAEFLLYAQNSEFENDKGWETLDEQQLYTEEELAAFEIEIMEAEEALEKKKLEFNHLKLQQEALRQRPPGNGQPIAQGTEFDPDPRPSLVGEGHIDVVVEGDLQPEVVIGNQTNSIYLLTNPHSFLKSIVGGMKLKLKPKPKTKYFITFISFSWLIKS